jgi:hypothetical protein
MINSIDRIMIEEMLESDLEKHVTYLALLYDETALLFHRHICLPVRCSFPLPQITITWVDQPMKNRVFKHNKTIASKTTRTSLQKSHTDQVGRYVDQKDAPTIPEHSRSAHPSHADPRNRK